MPTTEINLPLYAPGSVIYFEDYKSEDHRCIFAKVNHVRTDWYRDMKSYKHVYEVVTVELPKRRFYIPESKILKCPS